MTPKKNAPATHRGSQSAAAAQIVATTQQQTLPSHQALTTSGVHSMTDTLHHGLPRGFSALGILRYTAHKPRGPVTQKHQIRSGCTSTDKRGFVTPKFLGLVHLHVPAQRLRGVVGATRKDVRTASDVFLTATLHLLHSKMQAVVSSLIPEGTKTMSTITQQATCAAAPTSTTGTLATTQISTVLAAFNAANLASSYIERGNFAAARRKLVLALASVNQLTEG